MLKAQRLLQHFENRILASLFGGHHGPAPAIAGIEDFQPHVQEETSLKEEGFLWAVPKHRRTKQIRLNRKFGWPEHVWKPFVPKTNLVVCDTCGHHHISGYLCEGFLLFFPSGEGDRDSDIGFSWLVSSLSDDLSETPESQVSYSSPSDELPSSSDSVSKLI
ncbi:unnamed protein product [Nesidiocoris tenuis]|uniref:Uncharacterized protein n=1 Tax=Nesidiocoris tenuis TaxID=355587 RepID=A0A6H5G102_9HEMI|nr:unnamed protein product [Nesidiocoris tenuis]